MRAAWTESHATLSMQADMQGQSDGSQLASHHLEPDRRSNSLQVMKFTAAINMINTTGSYIRPHAYMLKQKVTNLVRSS